MYVLSNTKSLQQLGTLRSQYPYKYCYRAPNMIHHHYRLTIRINSVTRTCTLKVQINESTLVLVIRIELSVLVQLLGPPLTRSPSVLIHYPYWLTYPYLMSTISESTSVSVVRIAGPQCTIIKTRNNIKNWIQTIPDLTLLFSTTASFGQFNNNTWQQQQQPQPYQNVWPRTGLIFNNQIFMTNLSKR